MNIKETKRNIIQAGHKAVDELIKVAKVISTPIIGDTDILPGDEVIIHFNVFRRWYNVKGEEKNSRSYFDEDTYIVKEDQIFLYKRYKLPYRRCRKTLRR